jgi:hypothetical protein
MQIQTLRLRAFTFIVGVALLAFSGWASADPPSRVARLGYTAGAVSFSPAGESDWSQAAVNRPLTTGDRLWAVAGARAEIQVGGAMIRMNADTGVSVLNLDDRIAQLQLIQGTLNVRVRRLEPNQVFEVDTPNLAFTLRKPGEYRISVDPDGNATDIFVRKGQGEVYGDGASYVVDSRQPYRFTGTDLREYQLIDAPRPDEFDRWASERDRQYDNSATARYVSPDVVGYQDLDANGSWRADATYGNVWTPHRVAAGWAPYRDGHWVWVDPWGWTWVDDAPWGFAVSHYGRWMNLRGTWGWVPGPVRTRAYYAPALVAFVGGNNFQLTISSGNVGGVAWFPLAPREVYRPSYPVSRGYYENINRSNTVINNTVINNTYNTTNVTNVIYANRQVPGAVIAVPTTTFVQSQPVSRSAVRVTRDMVASAPVAVAPHVAPTEKSVHGAAVAGDKPPARVFERPVVARTAPPAAHVGFAAQQPQLTAKPGKPLDDAARRELKPAAAAPVPVVKVLTPAQVAPPTSAPPPTALGAKPGEARGKPDGSRFPAAPPVPVASPPAPPPAQGAVPPKMITTPAPKVVSPQVTPPPPPRVVEPKVVAPPVVPPAPATQAQPPRSESPRGVIPPQAAPPKPSVVTPKPPPQRIPEPKPVAPQVAPPAPLPQAPVSRPMPPKVAPPPQVAPPAPAVHTPVKPERAPVATQTESRPPVAAPKPLPPAPPQTQSAPKAEPHAQGPRPAASKPTELKNDDEERRREEEAHKQKR